MRKEINTDASEHSIGAFLAQTLNGLNCAIAYASPTLTKCERNCRITEREWLADAWAVAKFRHYIYGLRFSIVTDHHALSWLSSFNDPSGRLGHWS